jgi:hypothetical protein
MTTEDAEFQEESHREKATEWNAFIMDTTSAVPFGATRIWSF